MIKQLHIVFTFLVVLLLNSCDLYITSTRSGEVTTENGEVTARGEWKYTKSKEMDMYEYYQKWENSYTEFFENGTVKSTYVSEHKRATYGRPCKELLSHYTLYYESGIKAYEQIDKCDCQKSTIISYNTDGKVVEKKVIKTTTKEIKKKKKK